MYTRSLEFVPDGKGSIANKTNNPQVKFGGELKLQVTCNYSSDCGDQLQLQAHWTCISAASLDFNHQQSNHGPNSHCF
jgi:hypothetical protein